LQSEWELLLTACSAKSIPEKREDLQLRLREPVRWDALLALAEHHGILPILYQALSQVEMGPREAMQKLKQNYQTNVYKTLFLSQELIRIVESLSSRGIEVLPYKGLTLAQAVYGDIAMRQSGDIDLLIHARDFSRVRECVGELGFMPHVRFSEALEREYLKSGYECAFDGAAGPNLLEVQWAIQPRFYAVNYDFEGLFERAVSIDVAGYAMKTPGMEDLFLVLALHAAKHVWGRLIWLCDLARIMGTPTLNWKWIEAQAAELGIVRILQVTMLLAEKILGAARPAVEWEWDRAASSLAEKIQAHIESGQGYEVESAGYFRLMMRLRERGADRARFMTRLILTPGPGEWAAVRLPEALFPLYPVVRLGRLAKKMSRL
jgi:hypothetical protein